MEKRMWSYGEVRGEDCALIDTEAAVHRNAAVKYFLSNISGHSLLCRRVTLGATDCRGMSFQTSVL